MKLYKLSAGALFIGTLISLGSFLVFGSHGRASSQLGLEITTNTNDKPLYFVVASPSDERKPYATIPIRGGDDVSGVRIVPLMDGENVKFDVYLVSGDFSYVRTCAEMKLLPSKLVETRLAEKGQTVTLGGRAWSVSVKAVEKRTEANFEPRTAQPQDPVIEDSYCSTCGTARCGDMRCTPCRGYCMGCGDCGQVCCF